MAGFVVPKVLTEDTEKELSLLDSLPSNVTPKEVQLLEAWADPMDSRLDKDLADELGVPMDRMRVLRRDKRVMSYVGHLFEAQMRSQWPVVFKALWKNAITGRDTNAQRMVLEVLGKYAERHEVTTTNRSVFMELTDEELMERLGRLHGDLDGFRKEEKTGRRVFGPSGYSKHSYPEGPAGVSKRARARSVEKEGVD